MLAFLLLVVTTTPAAAQTPPGTWISNTSRLDFLHAGSWVPDAVISNASDTVVVQADTAGPLFLARDAVPPSVSNGRVTVTITATLFDSTGVESVAVNLSALGLSETTWLRDDGLGPDTTAGDSLWVAAILVDSNVSGETFTLVFWARDRLGNVSTATASLAVQDTSPSLASIRSLGWNMTNDVRVSGNALTVYVGYEDTFAQVLFEYKRPSEATWRPCTTSTWSDPNPDTGGPNWGIFWNLDELPDDTYLVRATARKRDGTTDPSPSYLRILKDSRDSWIHEFNDTAGGRHIRRHRYTRSTGDTSIVVEGTSLSITPSAIAGTDTLWLRITVFRGGAPTEAPAPSTRSGLLVPGSGYYRRFEREDGQTLFADDVLMAIPYSDAGLGASEANLAIYRYDPMLATWVKEEGSVVDAARNFVWLRTRHFTDYAVFGADPSPNLSNVLVYPNPFIPYGSNPQEGRPYVRGDWTTGIIFRNLTSNVDIEIYTISGRRVSTIHATNTGGSLQWDARADDNSEVASGMYLAVISVPNGERAVRKFMIVR